MWAERRAADRRISGERRFSERRRAVIPVALERRSGADRRRRSERRSGVPRRVLPDRRASSAPHR
jgi:hypothetical protein